MAALAGAVETLKATRPLLIVEFHSVNLLRRGLAFLARLGYRFETARGPLTQTDAEALTTFHESVLCRPEVLRTEQRRRSRRRDLLWQGLVLPRSWSIIPIPRASGPTIASRHRAPTKRSTRPGKRAWTVVDITTDWTKDSN